MDKDAGSKVCMMKKQQGWVPNYRGCPECAGSGSAASNSLLSVVGCSRSTATDGMRAIATATDVMKTFTRSVQR